MKLHCVTLCDICVTTISEIETNHIASWSPTWPHPPHPHPSHPPPSGGALRPHHIMVKMVKEHLYHRHQHHRYYQVGALWPDQHCLSSSSSSPPGWCLLAWPTMLVLLIIIDIKKLVSCGLTIHACHTFVNWSLAAQSPYVSSNLDSQCCRKMCITTSYRVIIPIAFATRLTFHIVIKHW